MNIKSDVIPRSSRRLCIPNENIQVFARLFVAKEINVSVIELSCGITRDR